MDGNERHPSPHGPPSPPVSINECDSILTSPATENTQYTAHDKHHSYNHSIDPLSLDHDGWGISNRNTLGIHSIHSPRPNPIIAITNTATERHIPLTQSLDSYTIHPASLPHHLLYKFQYEFYYPQLNFNPYLKDYTGALKLTATGTTNSCTRCQCVARAIIIGSF